MYEDFLASVKEFPDLRGSSLLVAGFVHARTGLSLRTLLRFLSLFEASSLEDDPDTDLFIKALLLGNLASAKGHLTSLRGRPVLKSSFSVSLPEQLKVDSLKKQASENSCDVIIRRKGLEARQPETPDSPPKVEPVPESVIIKRKNPNIDKQSQQLIRKLAEQEAPRAPIEELSCALCRKIIHNGAVCLECDIFHRQCLVAALQDQISCGSYAIVCPVHKTPLKETEYKQLLDEKWIGKLDDNSILEYMLQTSQKIIECPLCGAPMQAIQSVSRIECPNCKKSSCLLCKVPYHFRLSCEEFKKQRKARKCPKCNHSVKQYNNVQRVECRCGNVFCGVCYLEECACMVD